MTQQLYLTWKLAKILKQLIEFQKLIKNPTTPKMAFFVALADGWRLQTNATWNFVLEVVMVLDTPLWNNYITIN